MSGTAQIFPVVGASIAIPNPLPVQGGLTNNNAAPNDNNVGVLGAVANAAAPTWTEGNQVLLSEDLSGNLRVITEAGSTTVVTGSVAVTQSTSPWIVAGGGIAGSPGTAVLTVQGIGGGTAIPVSGTVTTTPPANASTNVTEVAGVTLGATAVTAFGTAPAAANVPGVNASLFAGVTGIAATGTSLNVNVTNSLVVSGNLTNNNAAPAATNIGVLPAIASAAGAETYNAGDQVLLVTDLSGRLAVLASSTFNTSATTVSPGVGVSASLQCDNSGSLFVHPFRRNQIVSQSTTIAATVTTTTILAAQPAGHFADISSLIVTATPPATGTAFTITLSDASKSYIFDMDTGSTTTLVQNGQLILNFDPPLPATSAATPWTLTNSSAVPTIHVTVVAVTQIA